MNQDYKWGPFKKKPNILLIVTDQQREIRHFPEGWAEKNLPALTWLKNNGISFTRGYANASPCTPSRGILFSGLFQSLTGVWVIGDSLPYCTKTIGYMMEEKGYHAVYKGKWHMDYDFSQDSSKRPPDKERMKKEDERMKKIYHFEEWTSPDYCAGAAAAPHITNDCTGKAFGKMPPDFPPPWKSGDDPNKSPLNETGGGIADNDGRVVNGPPPDQKKYFPDQESAVDFLKKWKGKDKPFFMVVSLANPHDVGLFPNNFEKAGYSMTDIQGDAYNDFKLPDNFYDDLDTKPPLQAKALYDFNQFHFNLDEPGSEEKALNYLKFYAFVHTQSDKLIMEIIKTLEKTNQLENTIIVRVADHGEMAFSHKLRGKCQNMYEETINVPIIFSNPRLVKERYGGKPVQSDKLVSLVDILPTLAAIAGWNEDEIKEKIKEKGLEEGLHGVDISKTILDPSHPTQDCTQDCILFTHEGRSPLAPKDRQNDNIRAVIDEEYKYGIYFVDASDPTPQYEMYNLKNDPHELHNLLYTPGSEQKDQAKIMHKKLKERLEKTDMAPLTWNDENVPPYKTWRRTGYAYITFTNAKNKNLVLDLGKGNESNGEIPVILSQKDESSESQLWEINFNGVIKNKINNKRYILGVKGNPNQPGVPIIVSPYMSSSHLVATSQPPQYWDIIPEKGFIQCRSGKHFLTGGNEREKVKLYPEGGGGKNNQGWGIDWQLEKETAEEHNRLLRRIAERRKKE
jgi:choline-sulfatase